jgi:mannose-6-phosphate isomerase-like protein (cupin superfamily)
MTIESGAVSHRAWSTRDLPEAADQASPGGASEIRLLPSFPSGALAHAIALPGKVSRAAVLTGITEFFYVIDGQGRLWRKTGETEEMVELWPARCATIPAAVAFQYAADAQRLEFIVFSAPRWQREAWSAAATGHRSPEASVEPPDTAPGAPWETVDLAERLDYLAPDGSEIRLLPNVEGGGLAHCTLPAGRTSMAVRHKTVDEVWYVLSGEGELWRGGSDEQEVVRLHPARGLTIPVGVAFQFRSSGTEDLQVLIGTFPRWPGPEEAQPAEPHWAST